MEYNYKMKYKFTCTFDVPDCDDLQLSHIPEEILAYLDSYENGITIDYNWQDVVIHTPVENSYSLEVGETLSFPVHKKSGWPVVPIGRLSTFPYVWAGHAL